MASAMACASSGVSAIWSRPSRVRMQVVARVFEFGPVTQRVEKARAREAGGDAVVAPDDRMKHAGRIAGGVAGDFRVTVDQRDAPAARREARGDRAAGESGADHDRLPVRCCDGKRRFVPPHAPARREAGGEGRFRFLRRLIANETGSFQRAPQHRMTVGVRRSRLTRDARKRLADRTQSSAGSTRRLNASARSQSFCSTSAISPTASVSTTRPASNSSRCDARHPHRPCVGEKRRKRPAVPAGMRSSVPSVPADTKCRRSQRAVSARHADHASRKARPSPKCVSTITKLRRPPSARGRIRRRS